MKNTRLEILQILFALLLFLLSQGKSATATTLNFEGFADSTVLTNQYPSATFSHAIILTASISLNEFEFPPHSGVNVVSDNNGSISIAFSNPVASVSGYFTYAKSLTLDAFDMDGNLLTTAHSLFSNNEVQSGDPGSSSNELIGFTSPLRIETLTITGDPDGGSFALDDLSYQSVNVPEPAPAFSFVIAGAIISYIRRKA